MNGLMRNTIIVVGGMMMMKDEIIDIPVYQRHGSGCWMFKGDATIKRKYKDRINSLYYSSKYDGGELLSINKLLYKKYISD